MSSSQYTQIVMPSNYLLRVKFCRTFWSNKKVENDLGDLHNKAPKGIFMNNEIPNDELKTEEETYSSDKK